MSGQAEASPLLKAALGFTVKMCCLLQKHASPPAQNKWAVPDIFTSNCSSVCGESCSLSRQPRPVHPWDGRGGFPGDQWKKTVPDGRMTEIGKCSINDTSIEIFIRYMWTYCKGLLQFITGLAYTKGNKIEQYCYRLQAIFVVVGLFRL